MGFSRARSRSAGHEYVWGSRFPAPHISMRRAPFGKATPPSTVSSRVTRKWPRNGDSRRNASSTNTPMRSGCARSSSCSRGSDASMCTADPISDAVDSLPAITSCSISETPSRSLRSPRATASAISALTLPGAGEASRSRKYCRNPTISCQHSPSRSGGATPESRSTPASAHCFRRSPSAEGNPRTVEITCTGSGLERSSIHSISPAATALSSVETTTSRIMGSRAEIRDGTNTRFISLRCVECAGGSAVASTSTAPIASGSACSTTGFGPSPRYTTAEMFDENTSGFDAASTTSA